MKYIGSELSGLLQDPRTIQTLLDPRFGWLGDPTWSPWSGHSLVGSPIFQSSVTGLAGEWINYTWPCHHMSSHLTLCFLSKTPCANTCFTQPLRFTAHLFGRPMTPVVFSHRVPGVTNTRDSRPCEVVARQNGSGTRWTGVPVAIFTTTFLVKS